MEKSRMDRICEEISTLKNRHPDCRGGFIITDEALDNLDRRNKLMEDYDEKVYNLIMANKSDIIDITVSPTNFKIWNLIFNINEDYLLSLGNYRFDISTIKIENLFDIIIQRFGVIEHQRQEQMWNEVWHAYEVNQKSKER